MSEINSEREENYLFSDRQGEDKWENWNIGVVGKCAVVKLVVHCIKLNHEYLCICEKNKQVYY